MVSALYTHILNAGSVAPYAASRSHKPFHLCPADSRTRRCRAASDRFASEALALCYGWVSTTAMSDAARIQCGRHGDAFQTFLCNHLAEDPAQTWYSTPPGPDDQWPDSWCSLCHVAFLREGRWNDKSEAELDVKLLCHHCYETHRAMGECVLIQTTRLQTSDAQQIGFSTGFDLRHYRIT